MRSKIIRKSYVGELELDNKHYENVKCELERDEFSNKNITVEFEIYGGNELFEEIDRRLGSKEGSEQIFKYNANDISGNLLLEGRIWNSVFSFNQFPVYQKVSGNVDKYKYMEILSDEKPNRLVIYFKLPYTSVLQRKIKHSWLDENTALLYKYRRKPFKLFIDNFDLEFLEFLTEYHKSSISYEIEKIIDTKIIVNCSDSENIVYILDKLVIIIRDVFVIIGFLQNKRINVQGYNCFAYKDDKFIEEIKFIDTRYECGDEYIIENLNHNFEKLFNPYYVSYIIQKFRESEHKAQITSVIYKLLTISENSRFDVFITEASLMLEAAARILIGGQMRGYQKVIEKALVELGLIKEVNFEIDTDDSSQWLITRFRHSFVHAINEDYKSSTIILWTEYEKIIRIVRLMILKILDMNFVEFPLPKLNQ